MLRQANNRVRISGVLSENNLKYGSFVNKTTGATVDNIGGNIKVMVHLDINGTVQNMDIPVYCFAAKMTKAGGINPSYTSLEKVMKEFVSIAACGDENRADKIIINSGKITMNEYYGQNGKLNSYPRIQANFIDRAGANYHPCADFEVEMAISSKDFVVDADGVEVEPKKLRIKSIVPQFGGKVDTIEFFATNPKVIDAINTYWENGKTYSCKGRLNFDSITREIVEECDFGEADVSYRTETISELIITKGTQAALDDEFAFSQADLAEALKQHKAYLETLKDKPAVTKKTPAPTSSNAGFDLGF